jgi:hypothetical protein
MGATAGIFLASILLKEMRYLVYIRYLCNKHAVLAGCSAFWPVKKRGHVAPLSGPSVTDLYSVLKTKDFFLF